jgi:chromatin segregation and condensation protein Rec8/ScpA/Scc1 (kleisin family)
MMGNLYEITQEFMEFQKQLEEMDLDDQTFADTLDSAMFSIEIKVENIIKHMKTLEALADAKKLEAKRLSESASADLKKAEWFKNYMAESLKRAGIKDLQAGVFKLKFQKGREAVQVDETKTPSVDEAPHLYLYQEPKFLGKTDLAKLIKSGQEIPGVQIVRNPDSLVVK